MFSDKDTLLQVLKIKSWKWFFLPHPFQRFVAWHPYIYVPFEVWEVIVNFPNSVDVMAQLIHAEEHLHAQKQMGKIWWLLKYCLSKKFRFDEEIKAIYAEMKFMKKGGFDYDIEQGAKFLSSWCYFGMTNRRKARNRLSEMWRVL